MSWSGILGKTAVRLGAVAVPNVRGRRSRTGVSRSRWYLRQRPLGVRIRIRQWARMGRLGPAPESLARKGETMTVAQMATYAYVQIDQARAELNAISK